MFFKRLFKRKISDDAGVENTAKSMEVNTIIEKDFSSKNDNPPLIQDKEYNTNSKSGKHLKSSGETLNIKSRNMDNFRNYEESDTIKERQYLGRTIAIANQKGGVGKSTTAVNMSGYLGDHGFKTLIIDFDPQSNSTSGLGINKDEIYTSVYEVLINNENPKNAILKTNYKNLFIMPSSIQLAGAEVELVTAMKREYKLKKAIDNLKKEFDFIIIDCPPALGLLTINALTGANEVMIPIQCEYYALEGLGQLINTINLIKENLNEHLIITGVLMTMFDQRTRLSEQVIEEVKAYFPDKVYSTIIPRNVRLSEAPSYGKPIIDYDPDCKGALAYKNLTEEVIANGPK